MLIRHFRNFQCNKFILLYVVVIIINIIIIINNNNKAAVTVIEKLSIIYLLKNITYWEELALFWKVIPKLWHFYSFGGRIGYLVTMVIRVSNVSISFSLSSMDHLAKASPKILNKTVGATFSETVVRRCSLKNFFIFFFSKFTGKHLCWSLFINSKMRL